MHAGTRAINSCLDTWHDAGYVRSTTVSGQHVQCSPTASPGLTTLGLF